MANPKPRQPPAQLSRVWRRRGATRGAAWVRRTPFVEGTKEPDLVDLVRRAQRGLPAQ